MNMTPKVRNAALVGALAVAATAWAATETVSNAENVSNASYVPAPGDMPADTMATRDGDGIALKDSLAPGEALVATEPVAQPAIVPVAEGGVAQPGITVEQRRLSEDERIQAAVMDRLASSRNISGKIGVESRDAVVRLSGYTVTAGQAYRAGREAGRIMGVKYVQNEIRPRIGGSV